MYDFINDPRFKGIEPFENKLWQREYYWLNRDKNLDFIRVFED